MATDSLDPAELDVANYFDQIARQLAPLIIAAYLKWLRDIASVLTIDAIVRALASGDADRVVAILLDDRSMAIALMPVQQSIRVVAERAATRFYRDTPAGPSSVSPIARVRFNVLDPAVVRAIEHYEADVLSAMKVEVRAVVKQVVAEGLRAGVNPRATAVGIKDALGLSSTQEIYVRNYADELVRLDPAALRRELTDGSFDRTVAVAIRDKKPLTQAQVTKGVAKYRANWKRSHAETVSRTVTLNTMREAQRIAWDQAIAAGKVTADDLIETWITTLDGRERPTHHLMHGAQKAYTDVWFVPGVGAQRYPGESEYDCRCRTWIAPRIRRASDARHGASRLPAA